jgi:hypothetical protein
MDCNRARALAIPDVKAKSAGKGFCGACRGRGAVGPRADEPGPYLPHGAAPGAPCASMSSPLWCGRTFFYAIYGRMSHLGGGGGGPRAAYPLLFDDGAPPGPRPVAGPARPAWLARDETGAAASAPGAAAAGAAAEGRRGVVPEDPGAAEAGAAAAAKRERKRRRAARRARKEEKRKRREKAARRRRRASPG